MENAGPTCEKRVTWYIYIPIPMLPYGDGYGFSVPRGYAPIVDCYSGRGGIQGVGFKGWGDTEVATRRDLLVEACRKVVRSLLGRYHLLCCWREEVHSSSQRERHSR